MINSLTLEYDLSSAMAYLASIDPPTPMVTQALALAESAQASGEWALMKTAFLFARAAYADWLTTVKVVQS